MPSARSGDIQPIFRGLLLGTKEPLKVTIPGQEGQEDLTVTENSDRGQFPGVKSRREMYRQDKERTPEPTAGSGPMERPQHQIVTR